MKSFRSAVFSNLRVNKPEGWQRWAAYLWLTFGVFFLILYYTRIWELFRLGPVQWVNANDSLSTAVHPVLQILRQRSLPLLPSAFPEAINRGGRAIWGAGVLLLAAQVYGATVLRLARLKLEDRIDIL